MCSETCAQQCFCISPHSACKQLEAPLSAEKTETPGEATIPSFCLAVHQTCRWTATCLGLAPITRDMETHKPSWEGLARIFTEVMFGQWLAQLREQERRLGEGSGVI